MAPTQHYVYILTNRRGTLYIGMTRDLDRRLWEHRNGLCPFTARYRLTKLVYYDVAYDKSTALARERQIKGWLRERKLELIRTVNPAFRDLSWGWEQVASAASSRRSESRALDSPGTSSAEDR